MRPAMMQAGRGGGRGSGQGAGVLGTINVRWLFWPYAAIVFTATHWPKLKIPDPVPRTDLWIHLSCFCLWTVLAGLCAFFGPRWSKQNVGLTCFVALTYAAIDEGLQFPAFLGRTVALDDLGANAIGVIVGTALLLLRGKLRGWQSA